MPELKDREQSYCHMIDDKKLLFYTNVSLPSREPFSSYELEEDLTLTNLGVVNIFVGANNCGKSRFLRALFRTQDFGYKTNLFQGDEFRRYAIKRDTSFERERFQSSLSQIAFQPLAEELFASRKGFFSASLSFKDQLMKLASTGAQKARNQSFNIPQAGFFWQIAMDFFEAIEKEIEKAPSIATFGRETAFYIPILRGMRPYDAQSNIYAQRTVADYFKDIPKLLDGPENIRLKLFTGLELYQQLKKQLLGEPEERQAVREFEAFLQTQFFDGRMVTLIPKEGETVVHVKIGAEKQLPIHHLGDGLQNLIIITYPIFMEKTRRLFFFEEPDLSMHPGMQRALLEVMIQHPHHQYFLTTHSNHLLDMSSEFKGVSIYLFSKEFEKTSVKFKIRQASSPDTNILKELGVRNSSVFLTNATIWVEGITDRLYLKTYLRKFLTQNKSPSERKQFREDYHHSFVEYQGSNLAHWTFDEKDQSKKIKANYLCGRSFLVADGDVSNKGTRREEYKNMLGNRFFILQCKEIENLIPEEVLKRLVDDEFRRQKKDVEKIEYAKYSTGERGLGKYLDGLLDEKVFGSETGTLKSKVNFCERAVELMSQSDFQWNLTPPLEKLCEEIYNFIEQQNT